MEYELSTGIAVLERTPATLAAMLGGLSADWTDATEGPDTWSPYVVVGHLIEGDRVNWIPRIKLILDQGEDRRFKPFDRFSQIEHSAGKSLGELLEEFTKLRRENLATLRGWNIRDEHMSLEGEHPQFGQVTLRQLLATWTAHDLSHIAQIARVMTKQYREAVGPWRAFLPVMDR